MEPIWIAAFSFEAGMIVAILICIFILLLIREILLGGG